MRGPDPSRPRIRARSPRPGGDPVGRGCRRCGAGRARGACTAAVRWRPSPGVRLQGRPCRPDDHPPRVPVVWDSEVAAAHGIGRARLTGRTFVRVTPGAYLAAADAGDLAQRCQALQHVRPDAVISRWTAVSLLGLPRPPARRDEPLHALVPAATAPLRRRGVRSHQSSSPITPVVVDGVRLTRPVRTWCDLARDRASVQELVVVADGMARRWPSVVGHLEAAVASAGGARGVATARRALGLVDPRAESAMESWVRVVLALAGLPAPVPQLVVTDERSRFVARVDLAWPEDRLVVEYDGEHHRDRATWMKDLRRREELERLGWTVLVVTAADVLAAPDRLVARVRSRLR